MIAFVNAFQQGINLASSDIVIILTFCIFLKLFFCLLCWYGSARFTTIFSLADRKCITITATQKTLALGLPVIAILFSDNPVLAIVSLPVIAYHTMQLVIDGLIVSKLAEIN